LRLLRQLTAEVTQEAAQVTTDTKHDAGDVTTELADQIGAARAAEPAEGEAAEAPMGNDEPSGTNTEA
jgi:hypothetical protein